ncbi:MAG: oligopeptide:H+ symporter [Myxococcales bacterium]|nr:oligopeptide:H+ symporter [Myxococcales bacterium]MCB9735961.1 MFS transporter [Deltaproteobacteria bacterium]
MTTDVAPAPQRTLFGHPTGLFGLFFAEMWERFSYYGMRALLVYYMIKGFLRYNDGEAYAVYGAYTALVYATPFIGGMLADRLLGARRAVILGGLLMAAGHLLMTVEEGIAFYMALALLIAGNGFFKPNISTIVGRLYPDKSEKRDGGFTLFYMGINLGAAMSPLLCGYVGETYGWHYGFGIATIGMLVGLGVFIVPAGISRILILLTALGAAASLVALTSNPYLLAVNSFVALALVVAGVVAFVALGREGLPASAGAAPSVERLSQNAIPALKKNIQPYYLAVIAAALLFQYVVPAGSMEGWILVAIGAAAIALPWVSARSAVYLCVAASIPLFAILVQRNKVAGVVLGLFGVAALGSLLAEAMRSKKIERERLYVVLILMFFSMLFWAFFEQAGSSVNNFTDRNVDRVSEVQRIADADVGTTKDIVLTQEQLGYTLNGEVFDMNALTEATDIWQDPLKVYANRVNKAEQKGETPPDAHELVSLIATPRSAEGPMRTVTFDKSNVGMGIATLGDQSIPASAFQSANPIFIIIFGLFFTALWGFLAKRRLEPSTPVKFALGLLQLALGFGCFWYGAQTADERGMVWMGWLLLGYLLQTTGELCLSPVGLSMVVKLSPRRIVSTVMGAWFLATAFSNLVASIIAGLTGVSGEGDENVIPIPKDTVHVYGDVFKAIMIAGFVSAAILFALAPLLKKWMHEEAPEDLSDETIAGH